MKVNKLFLTGAVALSLGLTACNNDDVPSVDNSAEGTTFAGLSVSIMKDGMTKAINDSQEDYGGRTEESDLSTLDLISNKIPQAWVLGTTPNQPGVFWKVGNDGLFKVSPWKTDAGQQSMALLFNKGNISAVIATAQTQVYGTSTDAKDNIAALSTDSKFVMTSDVAQKDITDGVDETTVKNGSSESDNVFSFDVERVVAQGMVVKGANLSATTADNKGSVKLDELTYAAVNGATKTYLFRNNAGERAIDATTKLYANFKSAIDDYADFEQAKDPAGTAKENLIRLGNLGTTNNDLGNYKAISVAESATAAKNDRGIYFLENSVKQEDFATENKNFGFYRLAYAKVYTVYVPNEVWTLNAEGQLIKDEAYTAGETFYRGEGDGVIYKTKEAAKKSLLNPDQKAYTYKDGKCAYRALWNRQMDDANKVVKCADVRRNNTYLLTITAFQGIGMPWDPSDPNDPNLPKPTDPEEPTNPENPDIEKEDTYMRVEAKVLQWNLVSRDVVLE